MDDLLSNFADHNFAEHNFADQSIESPTEECYKYHFVNDSPAGSEHNRPVRPTATTSAGPCNRDSLFDIEDPASYQATGNQDDDEEDYNADIEENTDDCEPERDEAYYQQPTNGTSYKEESQLGIERDDLNRSIHSQNRGPFETHSINSGKKPENVEPDPTPSDHEQNLDGFKQHLRRLHRQDFDRDEILFQLHSENRDLKNLLKDSVPGSNSRAEAAERSLFEIRKSLDNSPFVCVLIDGKGYRIHEDLLQLGRKGGFEAADRLRDEVSDYLQQYSDAKHWGIMVHLYVDVGGVLARCVSNDILLSDSTVRSFMLGFAQAQPLFTIVDVGHEPEILSYKVEAMFHLFANNAQCKHLIFGCCHNGSYAVALEKYASNPITATSITLLKSYESNTVFEGLPFDLVEFPRVFRSTPYKETDRLVEDADYIQDLLQQPDSDYTTRGAKNSSAKEVRRGSEAIAKWQATAGPPWPKPALAPNALLGWATEKNVLLNINNERVDHELGEVDHETSESMLDRIEVQRFCLFYHLQGSCAALSAGNPCNFRHGPRLNDDELRFLRRDSRRRPCNFGSTCLRADCMYGHVCLSQPGCEKGPTCPFYKFHKVDKTAVRVLSSEKNLSPRKRVLKF